MMPNVTILMPVYNGLPFLHQAIQSILSQSFSDFEFLIVDDGSVDGSLDVLKGLDDLRVRVVNSKHIGLGAVLNLGLEMCETELVARMDADDISLPRRLESQVEFLRVNQTVGLVGTQISYFSAKDRGFSPPLPLGHAEIYHNLLHLKHAICHPSIMARTKLLRKVGYRTDGTGEDWDMFLRMGEITNLANLEGNLYLYRLHSGSVNATNLLQVRQQYAYAAHCASLRNKGEPEGSFDDFVRLRASRSFKERCLERLDVHALAQYRMALTDILSGRQTKGYPRLLYSAVSSPRWTWQRMVRIIRRLCTS